ncbi:oxytocin receptor-like [Haemaphysalis longicornis]
MSSEHEAFSSEGNETTEGPTDSVFGPQYASTLRIALLAVMLVLSLLGNAIVCYRLLTSRRHRVFKAQVLFLNLALADLLVTVVTMNSQLLWEIMGRAWVAGDVPCRIFKVLQTFALVSSTYMLVGIAVDRHYAICKPLVPCPRPRSIAAICWLLSLLPSLPNLFMFRLVVVRDRCYCASVFYIYRDSAAARQVYMAFVFALVFVLPMVALVSLYTSILLRMGKMGDARSQNPRLVTAPGRAVTSGRGCGLTTRSTLPKARLRTLKMAVVIFAAFVVTNLPYMVQEMLLAFAQNVSLGPHVVAVFGVISASNSAVNPYVYLAFNGGATAVGCDARVRGFWRRLGCSSGSKRTTVTFRVPEVEVLNSPTKVVANGKKAFLRKEIQEPPIETKDREDAVKDKPHSSQDCFYCHGAFY